MLSGDDACTMAGGSISVLSPGVDAYTVAGGSISVLSPDADACAGAGGWISLTVGIGVRLAAGLLTSWAAICSEATM